MAEPEIYRFRLKKNHIAIVRDLEPKKILGYLYQDDVFDEDDIDEVRTERTRKRQAELLLSMLDRRGGEGYEVLANALEETQPHLAKILKTPLPDETTGNVSKASVQAGDPSSLEQITNMVRNTKLSGAVEHVHVYHQQADHQLSLYDAPQQNPSEIGYTTQPSGFVKTTDFHLISPIYRPYLEESVYKMTSSPRGLAVIVNINKFKADPEKVEKDEKLDVREGSEIDVCDLCRLLEGLDFHIATLVDKTENELLEDLLGISKMDLSSYDSFVLFIMSHGKEDYFYCHDGGKIKVSKVSNMFNNVCCTALCGKPKLFFIQACRGKSTDFGRILSDAPSEHSENENATNEVDTPIDFKRKRTSKGPSTSENADILIAYSSVEGYTSYRNTGTGSRFIRSIVEKFREYARVEDVQSMLTRVINQVNSDGDFGSKQVPKPETTLTKKVFFWPGIRFDNC